MALPSSGQISFDGVRIEMSQSSAPNYSFIEWASGNFISGGFSNSNYNINTPINVLSGINTFFEGYISSGVSMSQWYSYDSTVSFSTGVTASLIRPVVDYCYPSSMVVFDAGTSNITYTINMSGSTTPDIGSNLGPGLVVYYEKPWSVDGKTTGSATIITGSGIVANIATDITDTNMSFNYDYTYDANKGRYLYFVYYANNCGS
jgi:hypothetical protein